MFESITIKGFCRGIIILSCFVSIVIFTMSCGSDVTGGKTDSDNTTQEKIACTTPSPESVYMCRNRQKEGAGIIAVDIILSSTLPVVGAAFDIVYDPGLINLVRKEDNSIDFSTPEQSRWKYISVVNQDSQDGVIVVGASLGRGVDPLTGTLSVVTLKFKPLDAENHLEFSHNDVIDPAGRPLEIFKDRWFGLYLNP